MLSVVLFAIGPASAMLKASGDAPTDSSTHAESVSLRADTAADISEPIAITRALIPDTVSVQHARNKVTSYIVQVGDSLEVIAEQFGLHRESIFWANSEVLRGDMHLLRPDTALTILPEDGALHVSDGIMTVQEIADKYEVSAESIIDSPYNEMAGYTASSLPPWGMRIVVTGGTGEIADWRPPMIEVVDPVSGRTSSAFMPGMGGSCSGSIAGWGGTGSWINPLSGGSYTITTPYSSFHSGIDLGAVQGTPINAVDAGVVIFSGWNDWGYGNLVVLDHGNGWTSYYAHMSSIGVRCGQVVSRGGIVGQVGSTGNSSGAHLHFELRWGHTPDNPTVYIDF